MSRGTPVRSKSLNGLVSVGAYYVLFAIAITALWSLSQRQQPTPESPGALAQQDSGHRIIFTQFDGQISAGELGVSVQSLWAGYDSGGAVEIASPTLGATHDNWRWTAQAERLVLSGNGGVMTGAARIQGANTAIVSGSGKNRAREVIMLSDELHIDADEKILKGGPDCRITVNGSIRFRASRCQFGLDEGRLDLIGNVSSEL
ncbi:MAG: hypothetical protein K0U66_02225 [Gammaproteobacteria bacterium]|nr:hypothetical protein [Gammaproteobacteria bacterium]